MALTNVSKPTTTFSNAARADVGTTWDALPTNTWSNRYRSWDSHATIYTNLSRSALAESNTGSGNTVAWITYTPYSETVQSFLSPGGSLDSVTFSLCTIGNPTGTIHAKLYAHAGTYGTSSVPTGSALATSDPLPVSSLPAVVPVSTNFTFSGSNRISLAPNTYYCVGYTYDAGDASNNVKAIVYDGGHDGNLAEYSGVWTPYSYDLLFKLYLNSGLSNLSKPS